VGKKDKDREWDEPVVPAYLPPAATAEPEIDPLPDPITLATDVTPAPSSDEAVWDGQHWTHAGRVWDGSAWVSSPEILADRRAQATERFELATVRLLKALVYAVLSLIGVTFAGAALVILGLRDYGVGVIAGLAVAALFAIISLVYLWGRDRPGS
jgi:hypothetical protein